MIRIEEFTDKSVRTFQKLSTVAYDSRNQATDTNYIKHKHMLNPDGPSLFIQLLENDLEVGMISVLFRKCAQIEYSEIVRNPVDLVSFGSTAFGAINLYKSTLQVGPRDFSRMTFHTSNPKSDLFYSKILRKKPILRLGYRAILFSIPGDSITKKILRILLGVNRTFIKLWLGILSFRSKLEVDVNNNLRASEVHKLLGTYEEFLLLRDPERIEWRFPIQSVYKYQTITFKSKNDLRAYFIVGFANESDFKGTVVVDYFMDEMNIYSRSKVYSELLSRAKNSDVLFALGNFANAKQKATFRFPFLKIPQKFEPQIFPIYTANDENQFGLKNSSYITLFDLDVL
jgi:hypothetical protein